MFKKLKIPLKSIGFFLALFSFIVSFQPSPVHAVTVLDGVGEVTKGTDADISNMDQPCGVFVKDNYAYVAINEGWPNGGLAVIDISDPTNPDGVAEIIGGADPDIDAWILANSKDVWVEGIYAFTAGASGLAVFDISDPTNPDGVADVSSADPQVPGMTDNHTLYVSDGYAYLGNDAGGLDIVDVTDPTNPDGIAQVAFGDVYGIYVVGNYAYVLDTDGVGALVILNISNPAIPNEVGRITKDDDLDISTMDSPRSIFVSGDYAYVVSTSEDSLAVINISDPANPDGVAQITKDDDSDISLMDGPFFIYVTGSYAYVSSFSTSSLAVIDISDPSNPDGVTQITKDDDSDISNMIMPRYNSVFVSGDYAYVTGYSGDALDVIQTVDSEAPSISLSTDLGLSDDATPSSTGTATEEDGTISTIQYQIDGTGGAWSLCVSDDGAFDEASEAFTCTPSSPLDDGDHTMYIRSTNSYEISTSPGSYPSDTFTTDTTGPEFGTLAGYSGGVNLEEGEDVYDEIYTIKVKPSDVTSSVDFVEFYVDSQLLCTDTEPNAEGEYTCEWDTTLYQSDVRVVVYDLVGNTTIIERTVNVLGESDLDLSSTGVAIYTIEILGAIFVIGNLLFWPKTSPPTYSKAGWLSLNS